LTRDAYDNSFASLHTGICRPKTGEVMTTQRVKYFMTLDTVTKYAPAWTVVGITGANVLLRDLGVTRIENGPDGAQVAIYRQVTDAANETFWIRAWAADGTAAAVARTMG
jgi:hypothetical protein